MTSMKWLALAASLAVARVFAATPAEIRPALDLVHVTTTQHADFAPRGTIRIENSHADLNIEGWDKSQVEVTVVKSSKRLYTAKEEDEERKRLELIAAVKLEPKTASELVITTSFPPRTLKRLNRGRSDLILEYQIHVPRDCHLVVHHGVGNVVITDVTGDIEAHAKAGDIVLLLPSEDDYSIDAHSKFGGVESDFGGSSRAHHMAAHQLSFAPPSPKHKIYLRVGIGSINIKTMR